MKNKLSTTFWWFIVIGMAVLMLVGLFSCNPAERATKRLNWAYKHDRAMVAKFTRDSFPCIDKPVDSVIRYVPGKKDTVVDWQYIFLKDDDGNTDTVRVPCKCPVADPDTVYYDINHRVMDSSAMFIEKRRTDSIEKKILTILSRQKSQGKTNKVLWWVAGTGILATIAMGFIGSKGGWIVALIKGAVKIIQSFKKK